MVHMAWAAAVTAAVGAAAFAGLKLRSSRPELSGPSGLLAALLPTQLGLGVLALLIRRSSSLSLDFHTAAAFVTAHQAVGALLLGTTLVWTLRARREA